MNKLLLTLAPSLLLLCAASCHNSDKLPSTPPTKVYGELAQLNLKNAVSDAHAALRNKDTRLLAVMGYAVEVPGAGQDIEHLKATYGLRIIEGTTDAVESPEHERLIENARQYAQAYNRVILAEAQQQSQ